MGKYSRNILNYRNNGQKPLLFQDYPSYTVQTFASCHLQLAGHSICTLNMAILSSRIYYVSTEAFFINIFLFVFIYSVLKQQILYLVHDYSYFLDDIFHVYNYLDSFCVVYLPCNIAMFSSCCFCFYTCVYAYMCMCVCVCLCVQYMPI